MNDNKLRIISLGGVQEVGKNMTVLECNDDMIVIDCGSIFPQEDLLGVDLVIPNTNYLIKNQSKLKGFVITHGHEDHIGAIPYVLKNVRAPIYASKLTTALIEIKLKELRMKDVSLNIVNANDVIQLGCFKIQFVHVNHSIPGAYALIIDCPAGKVVFSGDFKIDFTPTKNDTTDLGAIARAGSEGVMCLLCESTNIEHDGFTISEKRIADTFNDLFEQATGRIIVAMFASNVYRIQMAVEAGLRFGRKVCFVGRSMLNVSRVAMEINELEIPEDCIIDDTQINNYSDDQVLVITTGSQGEPLAGLTRMASGEHRRVQIRPTDTVILSSTPIPGNEKNTAKVLDQLYRCGANVIYSSLAKVHASGHACKDEIKIMHSLCKPKYFIPIHGEYRMLWQHAELAESMGTLPENIIIPELGQIIEMTEDSVSLGEFVESGALLVDGLGIGDVESSVLRDRKQLSLDGIIIISLAIDRDKGEIVSGPEISTRGFIYSDNSRDNGINDQVLTYISDIARKIVFSYDIVNDSVYNEIKNRLKSEIARAINIKIKRKPIILPILLNV
ncbi:MAG: ribonuclease J [Eubacteriales bacterium]|nr:ribonuclease J [Eubacteriales bacterium]